MKTIYLNHTQSMPISKASWAWLALGLAVLVVVYALWLNAKNENAALQHKLQAQGVQAAAMRQPAQQAPNAQAEAVKVAMGEILLPWGSLLRALENANLDGVKMLALAPNAKTRVAKLKLVALDQASMWGYLDKLKQQTVLREVRLLSNETVELNGISAQEFSVELVWQP